MKKITGAEFGLLLVSGFFVLAFFGVAFEVYGLRRENKNLQVKVEELDSLLYEQTVHSEQQDFILARTQQQNKERLSRLTNRTQVLEASLGADEVRWAKIKKIRDVIKEHERANLTISQMTDISAAVVDMSEQNDVSIPLILAVIKQESAFNIRAVSHAGAMGLMQIISGTGKDIAIEINKRRYNLFKPKDNIQFGSYYLWRMVNRFDNNIELGIKAYNCGPICVEKIEADEWGHFVCEGVESKYPCETTDYAQKVLKYKEEFDRLGF